MVLGDAVFLTPVEVEQMREVPELVFINCCHLGRIESASDHASDPARRDRHRLAANLATQLIHMGVRAVVAAGWAVDDAAAETFARVFYEQLLTGWRFGEAVLRARQETYQGHPQVNTWGAYQCYGDPDYVLTKDRPRDNRQPDEPYVSPSEVQVDLTDIASQADGGSDQSDQGAAVLLRRVQAIESKLSDNWKKRSDIQEALGKAYSELDQFEKAVQCYDAAIRSGGDVSTRAIEQHANLLGRWAISEWRTGRDGGDAKKAEAAAREATEKINKAIKGLEALCQLAGDSVERLSLLGSAYKRLAWVGDDTKGDKSRGDALKHMEDWYEKAHRLALDQTSEIDHYPTLNWLIARIVRQRRGDSRQPLGVVHDWLGKIEQLADEKDRKEPNFWNGTIKPECELVRGLMEDALDARQDTILKGYLAARQRGASAREFRSVTEQLDFLIAMLSSQTKLHEALSWIRFRL
jgi:tetratricopeptide (TPR) repeat protein